MAIREEENVLGSHKNMKIEQSDSCPKCGRSGTKTEIDPNTGGVLIVCSNRACHSLRSKGWF
jgi:hypothetical protein